MKIEHSDISLTSSHMQAHEVHEEESLRMWRDEEPAANKRYDRLELSKAYGEMQKRARTSEMSSTEEAALDPKLMAIVRALESLTGKKIRLSAFHPGQAGGINVSNSGHAEHAPREEDAPERVGWGIDYRYEKTVKEHESFSFSAEGSVQTSEGTEISFSLALSMQRSSVERESLIFKAGDALIDPLVINFGSESVTMSHIKHTFDLDLDGKNDEFSFVGNGSGFLALDQNGDGMINDGGELFGPTEGNGFKELSAYDDDGNGWIDENDTVFDKLLIWTKEENGEERLYTLGDKNIGALYLERADTPFSLKGSGGELQGQLRESSVFLTENGGVGSIQEIDLKV